MRRGGAGRACRTGYRPGARYQDQPRRNRPQLRGLFQGARSRAGYNPATGALSSYTDVDSPARGLTFSAMTPNAVKRRRFRTKCDEVEIFLLSAPGLGTAQGSPAVVGQSEERRASGQARGRLKYSPRGGPTILPSE